MKNACDELHITTDDGSLGVKGFTTQVSKEIIDREKVDYVIAVGPMPMMRAVAELTRPYEIKTEASMNPIMVDGTGMCGACRVTVVARLNLLVLMVRILMLIRLILTRLLIVLKFIKKKKNIAMKQNVI